MSAGASGGRTSVPLPPLPPPPALPPLPAAIQEGREPNASVAQVLPCYEVLHKLEQQLA